MKKTLTLLLLSAVILLNACKKGKQPEKEKEKPVPVKLITKYWGTVNNVGGSGLSEQNTIFTYDNQNRLINMKNGTTITDYLYKDDLVVKINVVIGNGFSMASEISYQDGKPKSSKETLFSAPEVIKSETVNTYIYTDGFLTEIQIFSKGILKGTRKYSYQGNNISRYDDERGNVYTYKYDDKKNPYINKYLKYLMLYPDFTSVNNKIEAVFNGNAKSAQKFIYTYDDEGYPLTEKSPEGSTPISDLHFDYVVK
jgi:hypothetical protein